MHDSAAWPLLARISAAVASRVPARVGDALRAAHAGDTPPGEVEEVLLQAHLFVGFPDVLQAFVLWREMAGAPQRIRPTGDRRLWTERGRAVCRTVYGNNYEKLRRNVRGLHPDLDGWMVEGGYGRVIGRPGLPLEVRELCIVSLLAAWRAPRQLHSHLRGALNAGAEPAEVERAVEIGCAMLDSAQADEARNLWATVRGRAATKGEEIRVS